MGIRVTWTYTVQWIERLGGNLGYDSTRLRSAHNGKGQNWLAVKVLIFFFFFYVRGLREGKNKNENIYKTAGAAWLSGKCFTYTNTEPDNMVTS